MAISVTPTSKAPNLPDPSQAQFLATSNLASDDLNRVKKHCFQYSSETSPFFDSLKVGWMRGSLSWAFGSTFPSGRCYRRSTCMWASIQAWEETAVIWDLFTIQRNTPISARGEWQQASKVYPTCWVWSTDQHLGCTAMAYSKSSSLLAGNFHTKTLLQIEALWIKYPQYIILAILDHIKLIHVSKSIDPYREDSKDEVFSYAFLLICKAYTT